MMIDPAVSAVRATRKTERLVAFARPATNALRIADTKNRLEDWMAFRWRDIKALAPGSPERIALIDQSKADIKNLLRGDIPFGFTRQQALDWIDARADDVKNGDILAPEADIESVAVGSPNVADDGRLAIAYFGKVFVISAAAAPKYSEFIAFPAFQTPWGDECAQDWIERYGSGAVTVLDALPDPWAVPVEP